MTNRSDLLKGMVKDAYKYYFEKYELVPTVYDQIFAPENSTAAYEQYTTAIGPQKLIEVAEGVPTPRQTASEGFTVYIANKDYPSELSISNDAIDDHQKVDNYLKAWAEGLGETVRNMQETTHANIFNYGGFTAGHAAFDNSIPGVLAPSYGKMAYDAKPMFNLPGNERTAKHGGTYSNGIASLTLDGTGLQQLMKLISVTNAFNEAGIEIQIMPNILLCQYGSDTYYTAQRLLQSTADVAAIQSGVKNIWQGSLRLIGWRFLTDSDAFFIGVAKQGLTSLARMAPVIDYYDDKPVRSQVVRMQARWGRGVTNFRYWAGANFATS
jgi:hypothetical protein